MGQVPRSDSEEMIIVAADDLRPEQFITRTEVVRSNPSQGKIEQQVDVERYLKILCT